MKELGARGQTELEVTGMGTEDTDGAGGHRVAQSEDRRRLNQKTTQRRWQELTAQPDVMLKVRVGGTCHGLAG